MSIEYIRFRIEPAHQSDFIEAIRAACSLITTYPDCLGIEVSGCEEDKTLFVWRIQWTSIEAHLNGFRKDKIYEPFHQMMSPFIPAILEMNHYSKLI